MQHAGHQYGQGATNSHHLPHQPPLFAHTDISQPASDNGNSLSSLRQFRKKDAPLLLDTSKDSTNAENSHIARVPPHNHYPARPDYYRFNPQFPDFSAFKEQPQQVKYSEIAEPQQNVDLYQKPKDKSDFMDMCNIQQHMKQPYPQYDAPHQPVHPFKPAESQYQYQIPKYPNQCRKYPASPDNDLLAKLQRIHPSMARSIMSDHPQYTIDQNRLYQNQRYYPNPNYNYAPPQTYNYPSCNYPPPRTNAINVASPRRQYPDLYNMQKLPPTHPQYNAPEYAQHYQHRRPPHQEFYHQRQFLNHQITQPSPSPPDRPSSGLRHYLENWAEEETTEQLFKDNNLRNNNNDNNNNNGNQTEPVFVINSSDLPLEALSLVPTENGQYIIKSNVDSTNVVRIIEENKEETQERPVNLHIIEDTPKADCMLANSRKASEKETSEEYEEILKDMPIIINNDTQEEEEETRHKSIELNQKENEERRNYSIITGEEIVDDNSTSEENRKEPQNEENRKDEIEKEETNAKNEEIRNEETKEEYKNLTNERKENVKIGKRTQRIFSVDDIMKKDTTNKRQVERRCSLDLGKLQSMSYEKNEETHKKKEKEPNEIVKEEEEEVQMKNMISVEDDSVILEMGGALVQLNINQINGIKILTVLPLSDNLIVDCNGNYEITSNEEDNNEEMVKTVEMSEENEKIDETLKNEDDESSAKEEIPRENEEIFHRTRNDGLIEETLSEDVLSKNEESNEEIITEENEEEIMEENDIESIYNNEIIIGEDTQENELEEIKLEVKSVIEESSEESIKDVKKIEEEEMKIEIVPESVEKQTEMIVENIIKIVEEKEEVKIEETFKLPQICTKAAKKSYETMAKSLIKKRESTRNNNNKRRKSVNEEKSEKRKKILKLKQKQVENNKVRPKVEKKRKSKEIKTKQNMSRKEETVIKRRKSRDSEVKKKILNVELKKQTKVIVAKSNELKKDIIHKIRKEKQQKSEESIAERKNKSQKEKVTVKVDEMESKKELKVSEKNEETQTDEELDITDDKLEKMIEEEIRKYEDKHTNIPNKPVNKVTFSSNLTEDDTKLKKAYKKVEDFDETGRKRLSLEEYNSRKRKICPLNEEEEEENVKKVEKQEVRIPSVARLLHNCWEEEDSCDEYPKRRKEEMLYTRTYNNKVIIDVNEFDIKPMEKSLCLPKKFSLSSEDDSLQMYKDVVDFKLNSLDLKIPKMATNEASTRELNLINRFLSESLLKCSEAIDCKRKTDEEERRIENEERRKNEENERKSEEQTKKEDVKQPIKLHIRKVPSKKKKRFRNLYATETSGSSEEEKSSGNYSVFQRGSQAGTVPKLIFKRKSCLLQPFVKLERSQAAEMLIKKKKFC